MNLLVLLVLLAYPREFRRNYGAQLADDVARHVAERSVLFLLLALPEAVLAGLAMRTDVLRRNLAYAIRTLRRAPLFTVVTIATFAIAISVNTAAFGAIDATLLHALPFASADRLLLLDSPGHSSISGAALTAYANENRTLDGVASYQPNFVTLTGLGRALNVDTELVSWNALDVVGAPLQLGRAFTADDARSGVRSAVLSDAFWRTTLGANPKAVGSTLTLGNQVWRIVGVTTPGFVMPDGFNDLEGNERTQIFQCVPARNFAPNSAWDFFATVRTKPGVTQAAVLGDLNRIHTQLQQRYPASTPMGQNIAQPLELQSLAQAYLGPTQRLLLLTFGGVVLVLLVACANVTNLLLVRMAVRGGEFSVRSALGGSARQLASQLIVETGLLASVGAVFALGLAWLELRLFVTLHPASLPRITSATIDWHALLFTVGVVAVATLLSALAPVLVTTRRHLIGALRSSSRKHSNASGARTRAVLVATEIAVTFTVVIVAGLLVRSAVAMTQNPLGYDPQHVYIAGIYVPGVFPRTPVSEAQARHFADALLTNVRSIPGVESAAFSRAVPTDDTGNDELTFRVMGAPASLGTQTVTLNPVTPEYYSLLRIPLLGGRMFDADDRATTRPVAIVSRSFVDRFLQGRNPLATQLVADGVAAPIQIVGVVASAHYRPDQTTGGSMIYLPFAQAPAGVTLTVRTAREIPDLADRIAAATSSVNPRQAVAFVHSMRDDVFAGMSARLTAAALVGILALVALVLALAGIYGLVAYSVAQQTHEIGVRMALGARAAEVLRNVLASALAIAAVGVALGILSGAFATHSLADQFFEVSSFDPVTFASAVVILFACAAGAALVPATRATRVDPATALRTE